MPFGFARDVTSTALPLSHIVPVPLFYACAQVGSDAYLIQSGVVSIPLPDGSTLSRSAGDCVGEIAMITSAPRSSSVIAETYVEAYMLSQSSFLQVCEHFPEIEARVRQLALERVTQAQQAAARKRALDSSEFFETIAQQANEVRPRRTSERFGAPSAAWSDLMNTRTSLRRSSRRPSEQSAAPAKEDQRGGKAGWGALRRTVGQGGGGLAAAVTGRRRLSHLTDADADTAADGSTEPGDRARNAAAANGGPSRAAPLHMVSAEAAEEEEHQIRKLERLSQALSSDAPIGKRPAASAGASNGLVAAAERPARAPAPSGGAREDATTKAAAVEAAAKLHEETMRKEQEDEWKEEAEVEAEAEEEDPVAAAIAAATAGADDGDGPWSPPPPAPRPLASRGGNKMVVPRRRRGSLQEELLDLSRLEHGFREQAGRNTSSAQAGGGKAGERGGGGGSAARETDHASIAEPADRTARAGQSSAGSSDDTVYVV